jgi:hypothetical protein
MARSFAVYETVMDIFSIILQGFTTATRLALLLYCINTPKLQTRAANEKCLRSNPQNVISRNRRHLCEIDWTLNSSTVCTSKQKYETRAVDGHSAGSIYACRSSGWIQSEIFFLWVLCFVKNRKPTTVNSVNLVLNGYYSHTHIRTHK